MENRKCVCQELLEYCSLGEVMEEFSNNYLNTGMSSDEAMEDARQSMVAEIAKLFEANGFDQNTALLLAEQAWQESQSRLQIVCDGHACQSSTLVGEKDDHGYWVGTEWLSTHNLDFCLECQKNGSMQAAIEAGIVPHDPRTNA